MSAIRVNAVLDGLLGEDYDPEEYWWHALHEVLLMHATDQDQRFEGADPAHLDFEVLQQWRDWMENNSRYLRPNPKTLRWEVDEDDKAEKTAYVDLRRKGRFRPLLLQLEEPFADWKGIRAPAPEFLVDFADGFD